MQALRLEGPKQSAVLREIPDPVAAAGEVVVALRAAALNHRDLWIQLGQYAGLKFPITPGSDGAGVVESVGAGVDASWIGREVIVNPALDWGIDPRAQQKNFRILGLPDDGTLAEKVRVPAAHLAAKPAHLDWEQAAALPLAGLTAWRAVFARAQLRAGERVLVTGIGGGVALFALQFAVAAGAQVWVTSSSAEKLARARTLGAQGGALYTAPEWSDALAKDAGGFDVIVESAGGAGFGKLLDLAAPGGRVVLYGATRGNVPQFEMRKVFWKQLNVLGSTMGTPADFAAMAALVAQAKIVPVVDSVRPLAETEASLRLMELGGQFGKLVLRIGAG